jgi:phi13 family phage major tail protein
MPINANDSEWKSLMGLDSIYMALVTADTAAAYTAGTPEPLGPAIEFNMRPVSSQETQYADNQPYDVFFSQAEIDLEVTLTGLPSEMLALLMGSVFDAVSGRVFNNAGTPPYVALGLRMLKSTGDYRYYWFQKVQFSPSEEGAATKADRATPKTTKLTGKAIKTIYKWDLGTITDSVSYLRGDADTDNFSATGWFSQVQTPDSVAPSALALSSSDPVDNETGVVVSKTITLTFNNALPAAEIYHVVVSKADGTLVACTNSLDVTKKIMTVNPDSNMAASTVHIVAIGVSDIYGQDLQAVVNFTTA